MDTLDPELDVAVAAMVAENARFVVIGGFAVIANRFIRATEDIDFLGRRHRQRQACVGRPDQRLADRPRDRNDLIGLAEVHGELPIEPSAFRKPSQLTPAIRG